MLTYRNPSLATIILGRVTEKMITRLQNILRAHGPRGLKIYLVSTGSAKDLEALRDFVLNNYTFTLEVYTVSRDKAEQIYEREGNNIISILISEQAFVDELPEHLRRLVEVL